MKRIRKLIKLLFTSLFLLVAALLAGLFWASRGFDSQAPADPPAFDESLADRVHEEAPDGIHVITYNIHHAAGPEGEFEPHSRDEQEDFLDAIAEELQTADIVALQEVDYDASRSHGIDQLAYLAEAAQFPYTARITTWQKNYVPFPYWPLSGHVGRIHSGQAIMSRFPITSNERVILPQPDTYAWWYNAFYLNRSVQAAEVQIGDDVVLVFNCHLEAFDTPNRQTHGREVVSLVAETGGEHWIVLGDMNALPPEAEQFSGFEDEPDWSGENDQTIEILRDGLGPEVPGPEVYSDPEDGGATFPALSPSRRLDYIYSSETLPATEARILTEARHSDHLPVAATLGARGAAESQPTSGPM